ncbi:hypothetical protein [Sphingomonas sp. LB3N6]|uniref:hypothetical protein n=1 Tax=Sphingomonas fucosidasi TaxID=3096164 RepID=UPI003FA76718
MAGVMAVRGLCATAMSQVDSELRLVADDRAKGIFDRLSWRDAVSIYQTRANQCADKPDALFYQIDGGTVQFQFEAPNDIATKIERPAIAEQRAYLVARVPIATIAASLIHHDRVKLRAILRVTDVLRWASAFC